MSIFVMADTHLSSSVPKPMDIFGSRWNNWTEKIIENWKKDIKAEDTVLIPGDISWGMTLEEALEDLKIIDSLPGKKIISKGNHDYWWNTYRKNELFFKENNLNSINMLYNNSFLVENTVIVGSRGWFLDEKNAPKNTEFEKIALREVGRFKLSLKDAEKYTDYKKKIAIFHFPPIFGEFIFKELIEALKENDIKECYFGHIHGVYDIELQNEYEGINFYNISADFLNFKPFKIN